MLGINDSLRGHDDGWDYSRCEHCEYNEAEYYETGYNLGNYTKLCHDCYIQFLEKVPLL